MGTGAGMGRSGWGRVDRDGQDGAVVGGREWIVGGKGRADWNG